MARLGIDPPRDAVDACAIHFAPPFRNSGFGFDSPTKITTNVLLSFPNGFISNYPGIPAMSFWPEPVFGSFFPYGHVSFWPREEVSGHVARNSVFQPDVAKKVVNDRMTIICGCGPF